MGKKYDLYQLARDNLGLLEKDVALGIKVDYLDERIQIVDYSNRLLRLLHDPKHEEVQERRTKYSSSTIKPPKS